MLTVEADWNLSQIARGDLVLIDRKQAALARDGVYLLDLPGITLRAIARYVGDKVRVVGARLERNPAAERDGLGRRPKLSASQEISRGELLGLGRSAVSKVVGRAVWIGRGI